jgi:histidinol dehydrogenase
MIPIIGQTDQQGREDFISRFAHRTVGVDPDLMTVVAGIVDDVRQRGDEALIAYTARFDRVQIEASDLKVSVQMLRSYAAAVDAKFLTALREAIRNVRAFHERQREQSWVVSGADGFSVGQRITPIEKVGLYVPGGTAAYPSSVVMNVVPAQVAGVERIVVVTPPDTLKRNPAVAAALLEVGADEVYAVGGAQAIAALAFGTTTIPQVDKITGPGNKYVAAAKKLVFGVVGIDAIAGPTEVLIVADETARPDFIAADLLAQAEHAADASAVLLTTSESLAREVLSEVERQAKTLPRRGIISDALISYGAIIIVSNLNEASAIVNELAPEHVELMTSNNDQVAENIRHAGAIFFGPYSPESLGDYFSGPNHVLPTGRTARFSSALGVYDFIKRTSTVKYSAEKMAEAADRIAVLAEAEGLKGHAMSALIRRQRLGANQENMG